MEPSGKIRFSTAAPLRRDRRGGGSGEAEVTGALLQVGHLVSAQPVSRQRVEQVVSGDASQRDPGDRGVDLSLAVGDPGSDLREADRALVLPNLDGAVARVRRNVQGAVAVHVGEVATDRVTRRGAERLDALNVAVGERRGPAGAAAGGADQLVGSALRIHPVAEEATQRRSVQPVHVVVDVEAARAADAGASGLKRLAGQAQLLKARGAAERGADELAAAGGEGGVADDLPGAQDSVAVAGQVTPEPAVAELLSDSAHGRADELDLDAELAVTGDRGHRARDSAGGAADALAAGGGAGALVAEAGRVAGHVEGLGPVS